MNEAGPNTTIALAQPVTQPVYLVQMGFEAPIRFSTRGNVQYGGFTFLEASVRVNLGDEPVVEVFNENTQFGQIVLTEGTAARPIQIYQYYDLGEVRTVFDGEMGAAGIGTWVQIRCKPTAPNNSPRDVIAEPVFNHLLRSGTKIQTPQQIITIE